MYVERADDPELLEIKRGAWPLEKVKAESERLFQLAQEAYVRSPLPPEPDRDRAEKLCVKMIAEYHGLCFPLLQPGVIDGTLSVEIASPIRPHVTLVLQQGKSHRIASPGSGE